MWHSRNSNIVSAMPTSCLLYLQWTKISKLFAEQTVLVVLSTGLNIFTCSSSAHWRIVVAFAHCHWTKLFVHSTVFLQPASLHSLLNVDEWCCPFLLQYFLQISSSSLLCVSLILYLAIPFIWFVVFLLLIHIQLLFWLFILSYACWWGLRWHHVLFSSVCYLTTISS